jgi:hypothetical protein
MGDDLPDRSGDSSESSLECASSRPVALVLEEPIAGAAFWPSVLPTCNRLKGRKLWELAVETTDSVGLPGRSKVEGSPETPSEEAGAPPTGEKLFRGAWLALIEDADPLIVASLRRRSSKGVPAAL